MAENVVFESSLAWNPERPKTLIISCVDGRWRPYIEEFVSSFIKVSPHTDFMAVPGGVEPLTLMDLIPKDFNFFRRRIEALVASHGTRRVVAIAHQDCAWYLQRKFGPLTLDLRERQIRDLKRSAERMHEMFPDLQVETYYARRTGASPERVVFDLV